MNKRCISEELGRVRWLTVGKTTQGGGTRKIEGVSTTRELQSRVIIYSHDAALNFKRLFQFIFSILNNILQYYSRVFTSSRVLFFLFSYLNILRFSLRVSRGSAKLPGGVLLQLSAHSTK